MIYFEFIDPGKRLTAHILYLHCKSPLTFTEGGKQCKEDQLRVCKVGIPVDIEVNNRSHLS